MGWLPKIIWRSGAQTHCLKDDCVTECPIIGCHGPTKIFADFSAQENVAERMYQQCMKCGCEFNVLYTERPQPKIGPKALKSMFTGG